MLLPGIEFHYEIEADFDETGDFPLMCTILLFDLLNFKVTYSSAINMHKAAIILWLKNMWKRSRIFLSSILPHNTVYG